MKAKIYAEGGGRGPLHDTLFRQAWSEFFTRAGFTRRLPSVVRCTGRGEAFSMFVNALKNPALDELPILLVDSEGPVQPGRGVWNHLNAIDKWSKPPRASADQAYLMVQVMETWFLADRKMLQDYFGEALIETHLPAWPSLEAVPKDDILAALDRATAKCGLRRYAKGKVSYDLLGRVDANLVKRACPHAKALLDRLAAM